MVIGCLKQNNTCEGYGLSIQIFQNKLIWCHTRFLAQQPKHISHSSRIKNYASGLYEAL